MSRMFPTGLCCLAFAPFAGAATITDSDAAPSSGVVASSTVVNGATTIKYRTNNSDTDMGSTFLTPAGSDLTLTGITLQIVNNTNWTNNASQILGETMVLDFFAFDGSASPTASSFTPLWRATAAIPATTTGGDYVTFNLADEDQTLVAGQSYAFLVGFLEDNDQHLFSVATNSTDGTANAFEIRRDYDFGASRPANTVRPGDGNGGTSAGDDIRTTRDLLFYVQAAPVPEPASVALLGLGGLLVGRRRRA